MTNFLDDHVPVRVRLALPPGLTIRGLYLGQGNLALEILTLDANTEPKGSAIRQVWKDRLGGRAAPLLAIALRGDTAIICGPAGEDPPIRRIAAKQAERLCIRALEEPDRNAALRFLHDALPSLESELPGIRNEGLLSNHELARGARLRTDWAKAQTIRSHPPFDFDADKLAKVLDVLEAPWPRREEALLREQFRDRTGTAVVRSSRLTEWILATGLERLEPPPPLPPITETDVRLVCWMAVEAE